MAWGDLQLDCLKGGCGRTEYRRKALDIQTVGDPDCFTNEEWCEKMMDDDAPTNSGSHHVTWSYCTSSLNPQGGPWDFLPDIQDAQDGGVVIEEISTCLADPMYTLCDAPSPDGFAYSVIRVRFDYEDTFNVPMYYDGALDCTKYDEFVIVRRSWRCYYARRVSTGQFYAQGFYNLIRCDYPASVDTLGTSGTCSEAGGTVCSPDGWNPAAPPTIWQPPPRIVLQRLA